MADEEKDKAEKLAAAKKRFEELKKKQNKGKKGSKKKEDKSESTAPKDDKEDAPGEAGEDGSEQKVEATTEDTSAPSEETPAATDVDKVEADKQPAQTEPLEGSGHSRKPSQTIQSRQRSESFRQGTPFSPSGAKSPSLPTISAEGEVQEIYRKQHARIEELEKENKALKDAQSEQQARLAKTEEELEQLRESTADIADLKIKAALADERCSEVEKLAAEITSLQRQLTQAQASAQEKNRRKSNASPTAELNSQLAQKISTIESLELEVSNLRNQCSIAQSTVSTQEASINELTTRAEAAEKSAETAKQEVQTMKEAVATSAKESPPGENEDPVALQQRITILESDLRTANSAVDTATTRATSLEQKIETLTKLHKDATSTTSAKEKEIRDLKSKLSDSPAKPKTTADADDVGDDIADLENEELESLRQRIRELEAETYELRSGVWRERRAELQPGMEGDAGAVSPAYEDIDLNGNPYFPGGASRTGRPSMSQRHSNFNDVLQSGISAFTGRDRGTSNAGGRARGQSMGLLSEDGFDEEAFRLAQEEEGKRRIERIKEVKRGLDQWRGWRVDLVDMRQGGLSAARPTGPIFDI